jgi:hypothetical protein
MEDCMQNADNVARSTLARHISSPYLTNSFTASPLRFKQETLLKV